MWKLISEELLCVSQRGLGLALPRVARAAGIPPFPAGSLWFGERGWEVREGGDLGQRLGGWRPGRWAGRSSVPSAKGLRRPVKPAGRRRVAWPSGDYLRELRALARGATCGCSSSRGLRPRCHEETETEST